MRFLKKRRDNVQLAPGVEPPVVQRICRSSMSEASGGNDIGGAGPVEDQRIGVRNGRILD